MDWKSSLNPPPIHELGEGPTDLVKPHKILSNAKVSMATLKVATSGTGICHTDEISGLNTCKPKDINVYPTKGWEGLEAENHG